MNDDKKRWTLPIEEDPNTKDLMLTFPPDLLSQMGWDFGDVLEWSDNDDGSWTLSKKENSDKQ